MLRSVLILVPALAFGTFTGAVQGAPVPPRVISIPAPQPASPVPAPAAPRGPAAVVEPSHATVKLPSVRVTTPLVLLKELINHPPKMPK